MNPLLERAIIYTAAIVVAAVLTSFEAAACAAYVAGLLRLAGIVGQGL
jgi:hypothetical protein